MPNSPLVRYGTIAAIVVVFLFNLGYWLVWPSLNQPVDQTVQDVPMPGADGTVMPTVQPTIMQQPLIDSGQLLLVGAILVGIVAIAGASWFAVVTAQKKQSAQHDKARREALERLRVGMEAYKRAVGHYPVSGRIQQRAMPAAGLGYEWEDLGFPNGNEMRKYIADWPIIDPSVSFDQRDQKNQYLYYPVENGANFALYAHLESVSQAGPDYNQIDRLPRAWGQYNYRVGTPMQVQVAPEAKPEVMPANTPSVAAPSAPTTPEPRSDITAAVNTEASPVALPEQPPVPSSTLEPNANANPDQPLTPEEIMKLGS